MRQCSILIKIRVDTIIYRGHTMFYMADPLDWSMVPANGRRNIAQRSICSATLTTSTPSLRKMVPHFSLSPVNRLVFSLGSQRNFPPYQNRPNDHRIQSIHQNSILLCRQFPSSKHVWDRFSCKLCWKWPSWGQSIRISGTRNPPWYSWPITLSVSVCSSVYP